MNLKWLRLAPLLLMLLLIAPAQAQNELAALLEVFESGVEVQRSGTVSWIPVSSESIVGVGDTIRTDSSGRARVTFFETGADVEIEPDTVFRINDYNGDEDNGYTTSLQVLAGITRQQVESFVGAGSAFELITPGMSMTVRGTAFAVRVEEDGRSALITSEGDVRADADGDNAMVGAGFGVRSEVDAVLSEVIPATSFAALDAALDGYDSSFETEGDILLNVRLGPNSNTERIGSIAPSAINVVFGTDPSGEWYRIAFRNGFAWVSGTTLNVSVDESAAPLPQYPSDRLEDITAFAYVGDTPADAVVRNQVVNLRTGPSLDNEIIIQMRDGDILAVLGRNIDASWLLVRRLDGTRGWVNAGLVQLNIELENVPVRVEVIEDEGANSDVDPAAEGG